MKTCPHCSNPVDPKTNDCPACGAKYWEPGSDPEIMDEKEDEWGCFSILLMPVLTSLAVSMLLILAGFLINLILHIESRGVVIAWVGISLIIGVITYRVVSLIKNKKRRSAQ